jgi:hypothetical protein
VVPFDDVEVARAALGGFGTTPEDS